MGPCPTFDIIEGDSMDGPKYLSTRGSDPTATPSRGARLAIPGKNGDLSSNFPAKLAVINSKSTFPSGGSCQLTRSVRLLPCDCQLKNSNLPPFPQFNESGWTSVSPHPLNFIAGSFSRGHWTVVHLAYSDQFFKINFVILWLVVTGHVKNTLAWVSHNCWINCTSKVD